MRRVCSQCHARVADEVAATILHCPACGGPLQAEPELAPELAQTENSSPSPSPTVDHRGIVLPPRHAVGGIITPW